MIRFTTHTNYRYKTTSDYKDYGFDIDKYTNSVLSHLQNYNYIIEEAWISSQYENTELNVGIKIPVYAEKLCKNLNVPHFEIEHVIFNDPATIVIFSDGTKSVVKCQGGDTYDKEKGFALALLKKYMGNKGNYNDVFREWVK
jgi:hypothetical protein